MTIYSLTLHFFGGAVIRATTPEVNATEARVTAFHQLRDGVPPQFVEVKEVHNG